LYGFNDVPSPAVSDPVGDTYNVKLPCSVPTIAPEPLTIIAPDLTVGADAVSGNVLLISRFIINNIISDFYEFSPIFNMLCNGSIKAWMELPEQFMKE